MEVYRLWLSKLCNLEEEFGGCENFEFFSSRLDELGAPIIRASNLGFSWFDFPLVEVLISKF